jgi:hypothetical protein
MVVNERDRLKLAHRLQGLMGEEATILMEHLPYGGIAGIVSKDDLVLFKAEIRAEIYKALNSQTLKIITVMTALNGLMFAGLKWG